MAKVKVRKNFHQARWDEPIIYDLSTPGLRGIIPPEADGEIVGAFGDVASKLPDSVRRKSPLPLPEVDQKHVLQHWLHLSQETMGSNISNDISEGTCTMKYNPRINEALCLLDDFAEVHPDQGPDTIQGILEIYYKFENMLKEVSGMDKITIQPGGGNHAVYTAASVVRAYHAANGEANERDEVITTIFSHPCDAATPATAGYKVITIWPDERGIPDLEAIRAAAGERTAAIFMTNPEDIGIYNPNADKIVEIIHNVGGLCFYDQANANAFLGVARAREAGFDMCHFNVHKTFGAPHGCSGPAMGALCVLERLAKFLPTPTVEFDGQKYFLDYDRPESIGKVRGYLGVASVALKGYAWMMMMGADGLRECADISVINNNYMQHLMQKIPMMNEAYAGNGITRQEQIRYSFDKLKKQCDVGSEDANRRMLDFGLPWFWPSHHPWVIPEPMTLEPCESYTKEDIEEYVDVVRTVCDEAVKNPDLVKNAPYNSPIHKRQHEENLDNPKKWATTYKVFKRKFKVD
jgi:glycine dehydrogenase subunit 2